MDRHKVFNVSISIQEYCYFSKMQLDRNCKIDKIIDKRMISYRWIVGGCVCGLPSILK